MRTGSLMCLCWYVFLLSVGALPTAVPWWAWFLYGGLCLVLTVTEIKVLDWAGDRYRARKSRR